ncbi:MAG: hypothetical protein ACR2NP_12890 [Pirellulaceae bacterium]
MSTLSVFTLLAFLVPSPGVTVEDNLQVLDGYAGEWNVELTIHALDDSGSDKQYTGSVSAQWVVNNQFMDQTGRYQIGDSGIVIKTLMTFDESRGEFHYWYFMETGETRESTGRWDETTQIMTSTMTATDNDDVVTITADFSKPGVESWMIETKNSDGRLSGRISGTNTRK